jgi:hypothetical protein
MPNGPAGAVDAIRQAERYRDEAVLVIAFVQQISDPRVKSDLLDLAQRYLDLARSLEASRAA